MDRFHLIEQSANLDSEFELGITTAEQLFQTLNGNFFTGRAHSRIVDQQMTHGTRRDSEEMLATLPVAFTRSDETKISFVHQRGRLERMVRPLTGHHMTRELMQVGKDESE